MVWPTRVAGTASQRLRFERAVAQLPGSEAFIDCLDPALLNFDPTHPGTHPYAVACGVRFVQWPFASAVEYRTTEIDRKAAADLTPVNEREATGHDR